MMALKKLRNNKKTKGTCRLVINEDMTIYVINSLKEDIAKEIDVNDRFELNLADVEEIDSAGIQLLLALRNELMKKKKEFKITAMSSSVTKLVESYGINDCFNQGGTA